ncbi:RsmE family RNA methyltransferase [Ilumatobacter sp.]|uniref:RsmE family RNA methyltransferase n=1 Tax=Ilumatobacter sp. TaxID=1967498 RepID=UPI0037531401
MSGVDDRRRAAAHVFVGSEELGADGVIALSDDTQHHLSRVLRLRDGVVISVCDGAGRWRLATVVGERQAMRVEANGDIEIEPFPVAPLTLATAMPKGERLDWLVQKVTELGVDRLQLLDADHSVVRWKSSEVDKKLLRLKRIAESAAQQSRRTFLPEVLPPVQALEILEGAAVAEPGGRALTATDRMVAIGPEGGWSSKELAVARDRVTLGHNVLRTETAAVAAATLCVVADH